MAPFWDLNVTVPAAAATGQMESARGQEAVRKEARELSEDLQRLGYDGVAFNVTLPCGKRSGGGSISISAMVHDLADRSERCVGARHGMSGGAAAAAGCDRSGGSAGPMMSTTQSSFLRLRQGNRSDGKHFQERTRITVEADELPDLAVLRQAQDALRRFDLVTVQPGSEKVFHHCCETAAIDIISLDMSRKLPFYIKLPSVHCAFARGVLFELCYAPAIRDASSHKYLFHNAAMLLRMTKGRNTLLSSSAESALHLRGAHDTINLGVLLGMSETDARFALSVNAHSALLHGASRKTLKATILVSAARTQEDKTGGVGNADDASMQDASR